MWALQNGAPAPPPSSPPPTSSEKDASGLSRDLSFPEDDPAQSSGPKDATKKQAPDLSPPRSDRVRADDLPTGTGQSSSKDTQVDLAPPEDDAKAHPQSATAVAEIKTGIAGSDGVTEFHTWDPHKAAKSVEVGDFYFKRKNYRAAEDRYREALRYKDNDAIATIRLAISLEKLGAFDDAAAEYESYLRILPHGPQAEEARKAIERLKPRASAAKLQ